MTFRKLASAAAALAVAATIAACQASASGTVTPGGTSSAKPATGDAAMTATVTIKDMKFDPAEVTIKKGGTVTWKNMDSVKHDAADATDKKGYFALIGKDESGSKKFDAAGTMNYVCSVHPNMKGTVKVVE